METPKPNTAAITSRRTGAPAPPARAGALRRYGIALGIASGAIGAAQLVDPHAGTRDLLSVAAGTVATVVGGVGPGLVALSLSTTAIGGLSGYDGEALVRRAPTRILWPLLVGAVQVAAVGALHRAWSQVRCDRARHARRAARRVRAGERLQLLRAITRHVAEGLAALDQDGRILFMNVAASRMLGWDEAEVAGLPFCDVVKPRRAGGPPADGDCPLTAVLRDRRAVQGQDHVFRRKDGTELPVSYTSAPIERAGRTIGAAIAFQDFSLHVRADASERFLAAASRALTESIDWEATLERVAQLAVPFLGDWCLVVVDDERGLRRIAAAHADPARAPAARDLAREYPIERDAAHGVARVLRTGRPELIPDIDVEQFVGAAGAHCRRRAEILRSMGLHSYMAVPLAARGRTLGALAFAISTGARRHTPADLLVAEELGARCALAIDNARLYRDAQRATRQAQEASRSREELLAVVSHDLRSPLAALQLATGYLERLVTKHGTPELLRATDTVQRATARMTRLVDDLVDAARLERGRTPLQRAPHDAEVLAREAIDAIAPLAREQHVSFAVVAPAHLTVDCDRHRVLQVLSNLLGNALNVMPGGGAVRLSVERDEDVVRFTVTDTGPGISREDQAYVFDRHWRGAEPGYEGSGLGLAIAKAVVEAHGGRIWVESAPGSGAAFHFTLPAASPGDGS